ncbi:hypothetical protein DSECCO2_288700 [anaerobic digester metagenome]
MERIEQVEAVLDQGVAGCALTAVVVAEQKKGKEGGDHEEALLPVHLQGHDDEKSDDEKSVAELGGSIRVVMTEQEDEHRSEEHVVTGGGQQDQDQDQTVFHQVGPLPVEHQVEGEQTQGKGIQNAGLGEGQERVLRLGRKERNPAELKILEGEVGGQRKSRHSSQIAPEMPGVEIALNEKERHDGEGEPPDGVHDLPLDGLGGHKGPGNMVNQHRDQGQCFQLSCVEHLDRFRMWDWMISV